MIWFKLRRDKLEIQSPIFTPLYVLIHLEDTRSQGRVWKFVIVTKINFKSQCFYKILTGAKLRARIHFHIVFMKLWYKIKNTQIAPLFRLSLLLKIFLKHIKSLMLPLSALYETPAYYVTGQLISPINQIQWIPCQFVNKTYNFSNQKIL